MYYCNGNMTVTLALGDKGFTLQVLRCNNPKPIYVRPYAINDTDIARQAYKALVNTYERIEDLTSIKARQQKAMQAWRYEIVAHNQGKRAWTLPGDVDQRDGLTCFLDWDRANGWQINFFPSA